MNRTLGFTTTLLGVGLVACTIVAPRPEPTLDVVAFGTSVAATVQVLDAQAAQASTLLTATPLAATQAMQATRAALELQMTVDAATSTAQFAATQAAAATAEAAQQQTQVAAQTATAWPPIATQTQVALNSLILQAQQRQAEANWQQATAWFWPIFWMGVAILLAGGGWKLLRVLELRQRIVPSANGGAPMLLVEQKRSLEPYLPAFLRWIAWLVETNQVVVDADRSVHPITVVANGQATQPAQASEAAQVQVAQTSQAMDALRAIGTENPLLKSVWAKTTGQVAEPSLLPTPNAMVVVAQPVEIVEGQVREVTDQGEFARWVDDAETQLLTGGAA